MSLLEHQTEGVAEEGSRASRFVVLALLVAGCGVAAYLWMPWGADPAPVAAADPLAVARPAPPAPEPEPELEAPRPEPVAEPEPAPEEEVVSEVEASETAVAPLLRVDSDVPGASVFLDRKYLGTTPFETGDVSPGPHRVNVSAEGYEGFIESIEIGDELVSIDVRFLDIRLDASVPVVHKHRFGDCRGVLRADLGGIHYETDDDDAFSLSFSELELHELDYLEHTLTIRERDGRTYNFTDEAETADALFTFHRDVEQARERLGR
jgi:hypothetical protein